MKFVREYGPMMALLSFMLAFFFFATWDMYQQNHRRAEALVHRKMICSDLCDIDRLGMIAVHRVKTGFGSYHWECLCLNGNVITVP